MADPKGVTIKLTDRQRDQLRQVTGEDHSEIRVEAAGTPGSEMAPKATLARRIAARKLKRAIAPRAMARKASPRALK